MMSSMEYRAIISVIKVNWWSLVGDISLRAYIIGIAGSPKACPSIRRVQHVFIPTTFCIKNWVEKVIDAQRSRVIPKENKTINK